jgi:hypothetical protein
MRKSGFSIIFLLSFLLIIFHGGVIYSLNMDNIIAYPVPFNPNIQVLKIGYKPAVPPDTVDTVTIEIFDINGDTVFLREYSSLNNPVIWNGYNNSGKKVKPGLYIIKVTIENSQSGARGLKIIRIVVVH